jgi:sigma-E factor negative regulatory protein RseB
MRSGLLLTAAATVAVPGLLAVLGVVGHGQVSARTEAAAQAGSPGAMLSAAAALYGPFPVAPATARAGVRNDVAAVQKSSGQTVTVLSRMTARQQALGRKLLARAASTGQSASYSGTEQIAQTGVGGPVSLTSAVVHQGDGQTVVRTSAASGASTSPEGVFGVTPSLVALLSEHYVTAYRGRGSAAGRAATVVDVYRFDGSLAARYWLDQGTALPLRRALFDSSGRVIGEDSFVQVTFGASTSTSPGTAASTPAGAGTGPPAAPKLTWVSATSPARYLTSLTVQGWKLPATLSSLPLHAADWADTASGKVVDLEYSDGLYTASLFVERGTLGTSVAGSRRVRLAGQQTYVEGHSVTWAGPGLVYTMIADAPETTVEQAVGTLPVSEPPGLLGRLGRGLGRLARLASPLS